MHLLRSVLIWTVLILAAALAAQVLLPDPGMVMVRHAGVDTTTTIPRALGIVLAGVAGLWLLSKLFTAPAAALRRRRERAARSRLTDGLSDLHLGHWERAERSLAATDDPDAMGIARVHAARAAAARGEPALARQHLDAVGSTQPALRAVTLAEMALARGHADEALVALDAPDAQPLPPRGLALRAQALADAGRPDEAYGMLGALRKSNVLPAGESERLEARWARSSLVSASDGNALAARWDALPKPLRRDPAVVAAYAERAAALHWDDAAAGAIEQSLDEHWDDSLAALYGRLPIGRHDQRASRIQRWMEKHPGSPGLLTSRARLQTAHGDWRAAEVTLRQAIDLGAGSDAWEQLGQGYAAAGDEHRARICYANALRAPRGDALIELPMDGRTAGGGAAMLGDRGAHVQPARAGQGAHPRHAADERDLLPATSDDRFARPQPGHDDVNLRADHGHALHDAGPQPGSEPRDEPLRHAPGDRDVRLERAHDLRDPRGAPGDRGLHTPHDMGDGDLPPQRSPYDRGAPLQ